MKFLIADTFTDSLAKLTADEQKTVKTTAFDLQTNPKQPGLQFHKLDRAKDPRFWSVRGSRDVRLIVHRSDDALLLCYAGHHDEAYDWAERRKIEVHPKTGAAQIVIVRETIEEIKIPKYVETPVAIAPNPKLFEGISDDELLGFGVPAEWLSDVRSATEETYLTLSDNLPREAAEALLEIATGGKPEPAPPPVAGADPFLHPDALRRFRVMHDLEELSRAMEFPWEKWTVFLHPAQRALVERNFGGPARVAGSAGTGASGTAEVSAEAGPGASATAGAGASGSSSRPGGAGSSVCVGSSAGSVSSAVASGSAGRSGRVGAGSATAAAGSEV